MLILDKQGHLTNELIDQWAMESDKAFKEAAGKRGESTPKARLAVEETLLRFREQFGSEEICHLRGFKRGDLIRFEITQKGIHKNPLNIDPSDHFAYDLLARMNLNPSYSWKNSSGSNCVTIPFQLPKRKNAMLRGILIGLLLAVLTGMIANATGTSELLEPTYKSLFSKISLVFSAIATPLVFCAVISGISGLGDAAHVGEMGSKFLVRMLKTYMFAMAAMIFIGSMLGLVNLKGSSQGGNFFQDLLNLVLDVIPSNIIEPFRIDNDLQVIVLAIFVGVTMLLMGENSNRLKQLIADIGDLVNKMMLTICQLIPIFIYIGVSDLILSDQVSKIPKVGNIIIICVLGSIMTVGFVVIRTLMITKLPFKEIFSAQLPSLLINLTTSSQITAMPESMRCCKEKFKINEKLVDFALPVGIVVYMPNGAIMLGAIPWVLSVMTNGPTDPASLIKLAFVATIVAIAAPPIPGSAFAVMPILFSSCGTDMKLMPLAVIVASTFGYLLPALNGFCLQEELLMMAYKTGEIVKDSNIPH